MNFVIQKINGEITLDMCFQMQRAKEYFDWNNVNDSFDLVACDISEIEFLSGQILGLSRIKYKQMVKSGIFNPSEWCPVGTVEFVEKYLRIYFGDDCANNAMRPLNVPECYIGNYMNTGRHIWNINLQNDFKVNGPFYENDELFFVKDNDRIKNPLNGIMTLQEAYDKGLKNVQISQIIKDGHNESEWRVFIHKGKAVDIKNYAGSPFEFPNIDDIINSYIYQLDGTLKEGTLDVYVDLEDCETYVMECHKFFSCGLYGFDQIKILPIMYWRTYKDLIKNYKEQSLNFVLYFLYN